jgi:peptidoglycan-N-acetylglucosamine deacetylase
MSTLLTLSIFLFAVDAGAPVDAGSETALPISTTAPTIAPTTPSLPTAINGVTTSEPVVALTFDACATMDQANGFDSKVFEILMQDKIPATLYLSGRWVETHPSAAKEIAAAPWIELGNHTYSHPRLTLLRAERVHIQLQLTNKIVEKKLGRPALTLRPPAGAWDATVAKIADQEHMPLILWTVVSGDVGGHVPPERIIRTVLEEAKPGAIIIFHINMRAPFTKKVLPDIIAGLREKGFRFVTVSQLLALPDAVPIKAKPSRFGFGMRRPAPEQKVDHADPPR